MGRGTEGNRRGPNRTEIDDEVRDLAGAAKYLGISPRTLEGYITKRRFTEADGLRRIGDKPKIFMPVLRRRVAQGTLMRGDGESNGRLGGITLLPVALLLAWTLMLHRAERPMTQYPLLVRHHHTLQQRLISL